jgi:hypothetical protein
MNAFKKTSILLLCSMMPMTGMAAIDEDNLSVEEVGAFCEGLWKVGRGAVQERLRGTSEDEMLERLSEGLKSSTTLGPRMKHMMRTTVKGAYLTGMTPSQYAGNVQAECVKAVR